MYRQCKLPKKLYNFNYFNQYLNLDYTYSVNDFETSVPFNECYDLSNFIKHCKECEEIAEAMKNNPFGEKLLK